MKVKVWIDTGFVGATHEDELEFDDNTPMLVVEREVQQWVFDRIDYGFDIVEEQPSDGGESGNAPLKDRTQ